MKLLKVKTKDSSLGNPVFYRVMPKGSDPWGSYSFVRDTPWQSLFVVITEREYEDALYGRVGPIWARLNRPPKSRSKLSVVDSTCGKSRCCSSYRTEECQAIQHGSKLPPTCWEPISEIFETHPERRDLLSNLVWVLNHEKVPVVVVVPD